MLLTKALERATIIRHRVIRDPKHTMKKNTIVSLAVAGVTILGMVVAGATGLIKPFTSNTEAAALLKFTNPFMTAMMRPDVQGQWMTYVDKRDEKNPAIYLYNFKTTEDRMISWGAAPIDTSVATPRVSQGVVAYSNRLANGQYVLNIMNPFMYTTTQVASSRYPFESFAFVERNLVWLQEDADRSGISQAYWYDIDRGVSEKLTTSDVRKQSIVGSGNTAYWMEQNGTNWNVIKHELDFGSQNVLLENKPLVGTISASGNYVAVSMMKDGQADIYTYHTVTGKLSQVTHTGGDEKYPVAFGDYMTYEESLAGKNPDIALYNADAKTKTRLTNGGTGHSRPSISTDRIVWSDARTGVPEIYLYDFRSTETTLNNDIARTAVEIPLSQPKAGDPATPFTTPMDLDTDGDGISNGEEKNKYKTSPERADSDLDGLSDKDEIFVYHTNPLRFDSDEDGYGDGTEVKTGHNPLTHMKKQVRYAVERNLALEQTKARELKAALEAKYGKRKIGIHARDWSFYVNAYVYGGYTVNEIAKSSHGGYGVISSEIPARDWRATEMYRKAIAK